jgi:hypothetical protein
MVLALPYCVPLPYAGINLRLPLPTFAADAFMEGSILPVVLGEVTFTRAKSPP